MILVLLVTILLASCGAKPENPKAAVKPPASVENRVKESDLTRITLTPEAEKRLGIELADVSEGNSRAGSAIAGEVLAIPGNVLAVTAPMAGTIALLRSLAAGDPVRAGEPLFRLTPVVSLPPGARAAYESDLAAAKARLDTAARQLERARQLLRDLAGSRRAVEAAEQEFGQATAAYQAANEQLQRLNTKPMDADAALAIRAPRSGVVRQVQAAAGQMVASGAPLLEVADYSRVWLRVPVYAGDLESGRVPQSVAVRDVEGEGPVRRGVRVAAPPTADPAAVTIDVYYEVANGGGQLRPGQRLTVTIPSASQTRKSLLVPLSAILYDIHGGAWVYIAEGNHAYRRQRVELIQSEAGDAHLSRGPRLGTKVVSAGAAELFGTEFGAGK